MGLWTLGEKDWRTADHCRRVGGYAGAIIKKIGGDQFATPYHELVGRLSGGVHDLGKKQTPDDTIHRSWGDEGYGRWDDIEDMIAARQHPIDGFYSLLDEPALPEEARFPAGCHHAYPAQIDRHTVLTCRL